MGEKDLVQETFGVTCDDLVVALVEHSCGYLTPQTARRHIDEWLEGQKQCFCERCFCCYGTDLRLCLEKAADYWKSLSPEMRERYRRKVEAVFGPGEGDSLAQMTASLMYPTLVV